MSWRGEGEPKMKCKHCGEEVGEFYSGLDEHLWTKHRKKMMNFLNKQVKREEPCK